MSILPVRKAPSVSRKASLRVITSASMRFTTAVGKSFADGVLDLLGAGAGVVDAGVCALGALRRRDGLVPADVADDAARRRGER